jgi:outer membrane lipoprotein-sorting protein
VVRRRELKVLAGFSLLVFVMLLAGPHPADCDEPALADVVRRLQGVYAKQCCFQAIFDQLTVNVAMDMKDRFEGAIYVKSPGLIALEVVSPERQKVVIRGNSYAIYFAEDGSAAHGEVPGELNVEHFFSFLANVGALEKNFTISYPPKPFDAREKLIFLELTDRKNREGTYRIVVGVDMEAFTIRRAVIYDALGNYNRFDLKDIKFLDFLPDSRFQLGPGTAEITESVIPKSSQKSGSK